jgi:hypothetical protein
MPFQVGPIIAGNPMSLPSSGHLKGVPQKLAPALLTNIRLGRKKLSIREY